MAWVALEVGRAPGTLGRDRGQQLLRQRGLLGQQPARPAGAQCRPGDPVVGQLACGQQVERLVVGLEEQAPAVEQLVGQLAPVAADPGRQDQVVVSAGHLERVELERAEPVHHGHDALGRGRQGARRREQVADGQEAARHGED